MAIIKPVDKVAAVKAVKKTQASKAKAAPKNEQRKENQIYVSSDEEIVKLEVVLRGERYRSYWDEEREYLFFSIKPAHIEAFEMHTWFVSGRFEKYEG
jgi:hypothetical protein